MTALKKKHGLDPESLKKDEEAFKLRLQQILAKHSTKHAEGGIAGQLHLNRPGYFKGKLVKFLKENGPYQAYKKYLKYVKETAKKDPATIAPEMGALTAGSILVNRALQRKLQKAKEDKKASGGVAGQLHLNEGGRIGFHRGSLRHQKEHDYQAYEDEGNIMKYL